MTVSTIHQVPRSADIDSPTKPPTAAVSAALRALARAFDLDQVSTVYRDGVTQFQVSTFGLPAEVGEEIWSTLLAGLTGVETTAWTAGPFRCREASGLLLGTRVRVVATCTVGRVAA